MADSTNNRTPAADRPAPAPRPAPKPAPRPQMSNTQWEHFLERINSSQLPPEVKAGIIKIIGELCHKG